MKKVKEHMITMQVPVTAAIDRYAVEAVRMHNTGTCRKGIDLSMFGNTDLFGCPFTEINEHLNYLDALRHLYKDLRDLHKHLWLLEDKVRTDKRLTAFEKLNLYVAITHNNNMRAELIAEFEEDWFEEKSLEKSYA